MKFFATAILSLAALASAIDMYGHDNGDCTGGFIIWKDINPGTCGVEAGGRGWPSLALRGIPIGWLVELRGFIGGQCLNSNRVGSVGSGGGQTFVCLRGGFFNAGGYVFYSRKRGETVYEPECQSGCQPAKPDALVLVDGTEYDITGLDDEALATLIPLAIKATSHEEVPDKLKPLRVE